ncbi:MAG: HPF/RaiA family ribosome-associated protein [Mariniblastus sp.]
MKIEVKTKNVENKQRTQRFVENTVHSALERLASRIKQVSVRLDDDSKGNSEFIGSCRIDVSLFPRRRVHVAATGETIHECVVNAIRKMEQAVKHEIDRSRSASNVRHQQNKRRFVEYVEELSEVEFESADFEMAE